MLTVRTPRPVVPVGAAGDEVKTFKIGAFVNNEVRHARNGIGHERPTHRVVQGVLVVKNIIRVGNPIRHGDGKLRPVGRCDGKNRRGHGLRFGDQGDYHGGEDCSRQSRPIFPHGLHVSIPFLIVCFEPLAFSV
jgi:hypothetical protein